MILALFGIAYLSFFGTFFGIVLQGGFAREPYQMMNRGLVFFLMLDFLLRLPFQSTPTQQVKPYLLLPLPRGRLIDLLMVRSGLSGFNLLWMAFFLPFAILTVTRFYGIAGVLTYLIGVWLMFLANGYWFLLCRTLSRRHFSWWLLPVVATAGVVALLFISERNVVFDLTMNLGEDWIAGRPQGFVWPLLAVAALFVLCRRVLSHEVYRETGRTTVPSERVRHTSAFRFLDRYGLMGEYMRLEFRLLLRSKVCRYQLLTATVFVLMFSLLISFTDVYADGMTKFLLIYNFVIFAMLQLTPVMCYEGSYIDGLLTRPGSVLILLRAKYVVYSLGVLFPALLCLPAVMTGKLHVLEWLGLALFMVGPVYCTLFQLAAYNRNTIDLTARTVKFNVGSGMQNLLSGMALIVPLGFISGLQVLAGKLVTSWVLIAVGLGFILTSRLWIRAIYRRFMKRRYHNLEGFRASRSK